MEQKELMIGDWVRCKSDIIQIKTHWDIYNAEDFEPIPLAKGILEMNGFMYNEEKYLFTCWVGNSFIDYDENTRYFMLVNRERTYEGKLQYVHELQHILRICKIDKEIKL